MWTQASECLLENLGHWRHTGQDANVCRLSSKDLEAIQKRALSEGLPYQTLIASLLHKYATGRLKEI